MSNPVNTSGDSGDAARVRCLYCGANNFPASASCWQCGRPLKAARSAPAAPQASSSAEPLAPQLVHPSATRSPGGSLTAAVDPALAMRAAAALGLLLPFVGLPVGIIFLMLDDPRKVQIGWATLGWSLVGTVINTVTIILPLWGLFKFLLPHGGASPSGIPGIPSLPSAGGDGLLLPVFPAFHV